jgi:hypothetical protein
MYLRLIGAWALASALLFAGISTLAQTKQPDIVFVPGPLLSTSRALVAEPSFEHVRELHFNGDWAGVILCRAKKCVKFEEALK